MENYNNYNNQPQQDIALDWDSPIYEDAPEFVLLPEGEYTFRVASTERAQYNGSDKTPACHMAKVNIEITDPASGKVAKIQHSFFLLKSREGYISQFFASLGMKKKGERVQMNWPASVGRTGRCTVGFREYNGNKYNQVKKFLEPEFVNTTFTPGQF